MAFISFILGFIGFHWYFIYKSQTRNFQPLGSQIYQSGSQSHMGLNHCWVFDVANRMTFLAVHILKRAFQPVGWDWARQILTSCRSCGWASLACLLLAMLSAAPCEKPHVCLFMFAFFACRVRACVSAILMYPDVSSHATARTRTNNHTVNNRGQWWWTMFTHGWQPSLLTFMVND